MSIKSICFFNSAKEWGGGEKWHYEMAMKMHKNGYNVVFFTNKNSVLLKKLKNSGIKTYSLLILKFSFLNYFKIVKLSQLFAENNISHIVINLSADLKLSGLAAKKAKIKNIIYRRGSAIAIKNNFFNRYLFKNVVTNIITNTEQTKKTINKNNKKLFPENKIKVIYNGIDLNKFDKSGNVNNQQKNNNDINFIIGNIGRLVEQKAQYYMIDLAVELKKRNFNFKIFIGGKGRLEKKLKKYSKSKKVDDCVIFVGFVENTRKFMQKIDVFVLTSKWEGFGYVLVEAMATQKPVIAFDISSNPEIIDNNKNGYLVKFGKINKMADKILFMADKKNLIKKFGKNGRERVEEFFTFEKSYKSFIDYLQTLNK